MERLLSHVLGEPLLTGRDAFSLPINLGSKSCNQFGVNMYETWVFIHNGGEAIRNDRNFIPVLKDLEEMAKKHGVEITLFVEGSE